MLLLLVLPEELLANILIQCGDFDSCVATFAHLKATCHTTARLCDVAVRTVLARRGMDDVELLWPGEPVLRALQFSRYGCLRLEGAGSDYCNGDFVVVGFGHYPHRRRPSTQVHRGFSSLSRPSSAEEERMPVWGHVQHPTVVSIEYYLPTKQCVRC